MLLRAEVMSTTNTGPAVEENTALASLADHQLANRFSQQQAATACPASQRRPTPLSTLHRQSCTRRWSRRQTKPTFALFLPTVQGVEVQPVHACARSIRFCYKVPGAVYVSTCRGRSTGAV